MVHTEAYAGWAFSSAHPTQGRRFGGARARLLEHASTRGLRVDEVHSDLLPSRELMERVHTPAYVDEVIVGGVCREWNGPRPELGHLAHRMVGGTMLAAQALVDGRTLTAVHFAGAKHHAMRDHSSGFCVFNDLAVTATHLLEGDMRRISVIDIDAHHGDGTETLLRDHPRVQTLSVHDATIFPGTGHADELSHEVFNEPLPGGAGDDQLMAAVSRFIGEVRRFSPDLLMLATGADGHATDPLSSLTYTIDGMEAAVYSVRAAFPTLPILVGGAGGYQPDDVTPEVWARMAVAAA